MRTNEVSYVYYQSLNPNASTDLVKNEVQGVPTMFNDNLAIKSPNVTKTRKKIVKVCLHSS